MSSFNVEHDYFAERIAGFVDSSRDLCTRACAQMALRLLRSFSTSDAPFSIRIDYHHLTVLVLICCFSRRQTAREQGTHARFSVSVTLTLTLTRRL